MDRSNDVVGDPWEEDAGEPARSVRGAADARPLDARARQDAAAASAKEMLRRHGRLVWQKLWWARLPGDAAERIHAEVFVDLYRGTLKAGPPRNVEAMLTTITARRICDYFEQRGREPHVADGVETDDPPGQPADARADRGRPRTGEDSPCGDRQAAGEVPDPHREDRHGGNDP